MEKKIVTCAVFFIVTQGSVLLSSATFNGFSEESVAIFEQFTSQDHAARSKAVAGLTEFFDLLKNGTGQTHTDHSVEVTPFYEALSLTAEWIKITFNATALILDSNCTVLEITVNESIHGTNGVIHEWMTSIALTYGGNHEENQSDIERNKKSSKTGVVNMLKPYFDLLRRCSNDNSYEFESLMEDVQQKLHENLKTIIKAIYEAIEAYGIITSDSCTEEVAADAEASIEKNQALAIATIVDNIKMLFSLMETRYVNIYINGSSISHEMYVLRMTRKDVSDKCDEVVRIVFLEINDKLLGHTNGATLSDLPANSTDLTEAVAISTLQDAKDLFLDTVSLTLPETTDAVLVGRLMLSQIVPVVIGNYYHGIGLAEAEILPLDSALLTIGSVKEIQRLVSNFMVASAFKVFGNDTNTAVRLAELEKIVATSWQGTYNAAFSAIEVLAKAARKIDGATPGDFDEIEILQAIAISEINTAVHYLVGANVRRLIVSHGY